MIEEPRAYHYAILAIEPITYIEANHMGFHDGNVVKYITRYKYKDGIEDLKKAKWYLERLIEREEERMNEEQKNRRDVCQNI